MQDREFLYWLRGRLVNVYGESELTDFVHKLGAVAEAQPPDQDTQWPDSSVRPFDEYPEGNPMKLGLPTGRPLAFGSSRDAALYRSSGVPDGGHPPFLDEHLTYEYRCNSPEEFARMVQILLDANTCFAVIGGEQALRFHDRGAQALGLELHP